MNALYNLEKLTKSPKTQVLVCDSVAAVEAAQKRLGEGVVATTWPGGKDDVEDADWSPLSMRDVGLLTRPTLTGQLVMVLCPIVASIKIISRPADADDDWNLASAPDGFSLRANAKLAYSVPKPAVQDGAPAEATKTPTEKFQAPVAPPDVSIWQPAAPVAAPSRHTSDVDFPSLMEPVVRRLLGEPNAQLSKAAELRFGSHGSLSVDLEKGVWHDHETGAGGGVLDLIVHKGEALDREGAARWLKQEGFVAQAVAPTPASNPEGAARKLAQIRADFRSGDEAQPGHDYIIRKEGKPDGLRVVSWPLRGWSKFKDHSLEGWLMVPAFHDVGNAGDVMSIQFIGPNNGQKLNAPVPIKGYTFTVGELKQGEKAFIVEGIGHAWSMNTVTGGAAVVSFSASNIEVVAAAVQAAGAIPVIVPDRGKEADAARIAARLGCGYAPLPADLADGADVNDLHLVRGDDAVRAAVAAALVPTEPYSSVGAAASRYLSYRCQGGR